MKKLILNLALILAVFSLPAQDLADLFEQNKHSVVTIYVAEEVNTGMGDPRTFTSNMGLGSGVLIREDLILTASHVVANAEAIMVQFFSGETLQAEVVRVSRMADVALIRLTQAPKDARIAKLGDSDLTRIGEEVFVIGAPMGLPYSLSRGVISGRHAEQKITTDGNQVEFFQTDAAINTGNSGGPMFNYRGEVIGIVSSILSRSGGFEGIGFAATSGICEELLTVRSATYFGIDAALLSYELARILNVPQESGWLIQHVTRESPAGKIGLRGGFRKVTIAEEDILLGGDIILQVADIKITGPESVEQLMEYINQGHTGVKAIPIIVLRAGEIREFTWIQSDF